MTATFSWTGQQTAIFDHARNSRENLVVVARAGTGKTTSILEAASHAPERKILLAAFNTRIKDELKDKVRDPRCEVKTLNSVGNAFVRRAWRGVKVDKWRGRDLARRAAGQNAPNEIVTAIANLAEKGKLMAPFATESDLEDLAWQFGITTDDEDAEEGYDLAYLCRCAHKAMELACENDGRIDFNDQVYLPVRLRLTRAWWNLVIVDEAQDMSYTQLELARRACKRGGRIIVVGDDCQAIYGFRGADSDSLNRLKRELDARELGLTVTYRCPRQIVELAKRLVPDYTAADGADEGIVRAVEGSDALLAEATPGDFILSRKNAPLAGLCLALLRRGRRAYIAGRDIGNGLRAVVKKVAGRTCTDLVEFAARLRKWTERETAKAAAKGERGEAQVERLADQEETLSALSEGLATVAELDARIGELFAAMNARNAVILSSVHKAKGLETETVYLLESTFSERTQEERNIKYVAITRAKKELVWVR